MINQLHYRGIVVIYVGKKGQEKIIMRNTKVRFCLVTPPNSDGILPLDAIHMRDNQLSHCLANYSHGAKLL